ncbi:MAG: rhomboid family intrarane serine protease [Frankiales bacterium]|nr:rhomboid family intrarane serine protease [Frankiales bacterium]
MPAGSVPVCYRHPDRETYVRCSRCERPICPDDMVAAPVGFHCPDDARAGARSVRQPRTTYGGAVTTGIRVTQVLVGLNVVVFLATALGGTSLGFGGGASPLFARLALQPIARDYGGEIGIVAGVVDGQYWRLLTATFLHFGFVHVLLNMLALLQLGPVLEPALGRARFLALYLLSGIAGTTASYVFGPETQIAAGASGAVFGLFAAAYVVERRRGSAAAQQYAVLLGFNLVLTFAIPFIDVRGHLGGLVGGGLAAAALVLAPPGRNRTAVQVTGLALLALVLVTAVALRTVALTT